jgi:hypothetical protein
MMAGVKGAKSPDPRRNSEETKLCECGCGTVIKKWRRADRGGGYVERHFVHGHHSRVIDCFRGRKHTGTARAKQSLKASLRGNNGNLNRTNNGQGVPLSEAHKRKLRGPRHQTRGSGNHAWKGGAPNYRLASIDWEERRAVVLLRDSYTCQRCGRQYAPAQRRFLHVHHIVPYAQCESEHPDALENLTTLCISCHARADHEWKVEHGSH